MFGLMSRRERAEPAPLVRREEDPFRLLRRELGSMFDWIMEGRPTLFGPENRLLEMEDLEKEVVIRAELPGFEVGELNIHLAGDMLTISAEHKEEKGKEVEEKAERYASLRKSVLLPPGIDTDKVTAVYRNGVLEVHLPRKPETMGRRIEVKT